MVARIFCFLLLVCCAFLAWSWPATADHALEIDLAENHVDITTGFTGGHMVLFGVKNDPDAELAVVIRGPSRDVTVWKKAKVLGTAWMNRYSETFKDVPLFYDYALSDPELETEQPDLLRKFGIGPEGWGFETDDKKKDDRAQVFLSELIKQRQAHGLYPEHGEELHWLSDNFFRLSFYMPANVPIGQYEIATYLIKGGKVTEKRMTSLSVEQVGLNARINDFAHSHAFSYGVLCVVLAFSVGWIVSILKT